MMSAGRPTISVVQRAPAIVAIAGLLVGTGLMAGCGGGRIGEIASERAATAAMPTTTAATTLAAATDSTQVAGVPVPAPTSPGTSTDLADAGTRFGNDLRDMVAAVASIQVALTGATDPATSGPAVDQVTRDLQVFDRAAASLGAYRVAQDDVDALRGRIAGAAPAASDAIRAFIDTARQVADTNDAAGLAAARDQLNSALSAFLAAVPPGA